MHIGELSGPRSFEHINCRGRNFKRIIDDFDLLSVNSQHDCTGRVETFYSNEGCTKTTVDHIFIAKDKHHIILRSAVLSDCSSNLSYHLPIRCVMKYDLLVKPEESAHKILLWNKLEDKSYRDKYENKIATTFQSNHHRDLDITSGEILEDTIEDVVLKLRAAALAAVPSRKPKPYLKSYWNTSLKTLSKNVKKARRAWIVDGRPRGQEFQSFVNYKQANREFRKAQRRAIYEEESKSIQKLEKQYDIDRSTFMQKVSHQRKKKDSRNLTLEVDGRLIEDDDGLLEVWKQH